MVTIIFIIAICADKYKTLYITVKNLNVSTHLTSVHSQMHKCMHVYIHTYLYIYIHICICICMCISYILMHACVHEFTCFFFFLRSLHYKKIFHHLIARFEATGTILHFVITSITKIITKKE